MFKLFMRLTALGLASTFVLAVATCVTAVVWGNAAADRLPYGLLITFGMMAVGLLGASVHDFRAGRKSR
jgi:hypothetical protein